MRIMRITDLGFREHLPDLVDYASFFPYLPKLQTIIVPPSHLFLCRHTYCAAH